MSNLQTPFRYDFVGSFLRPEKLKKARRQFNEGKIDAAALKKVEDEAITELVSKIKELGYHVITDGSHLASGFHVGIRRHRPYPYQDGTSVPRRGGHGG